MTTLKKYSKLLLMALAICISMGTDLPQSVASAEQSPTNKEVSIASLVKIEANETNSVVNTNAPFLRTTGFLDAWNNFNAEVTSTIAIIDTGVDFNHPDLKPFLLSGKNMISPTKPPQDDNGHGTAVAGVIVAVAKAGESLGRPKWQGRIMPIKALDKNGAGDDQHLTQAINYAVEQGADIIVLSLGLRRDEPNLRKAVQDAENNGVLLIAASGNDAVNFGNKAKVQYPAAYTSVLAISGSNVLTPVKQSTPGPEVDISAAWKVDTLAIGGGTATMEGSSMGAPQVAAAAAMLKAQNPDWSPHRVREALRSTAQRNEAFSWDSKIGYGYLAVNKALQYDGSVDWREPNDTKDKAKVFPEGKEVAGKWTSVSDVDWYSVEIRYDGLYSVSGEGVQLALYNSSGSDLITGTTNASSNTTQWRLAKGRYLLKVANTNSVNNEYRLTNQFVIAADALEPNDRAATAFTLAPRSQTWTGTFHQRGDEDWMIINLPVEGTLRLAITTDTVRIDLELMIQPIGGSILIADDQGDGGSEELIMKNAKPGKYYIRIKNVVSPNPEPVVGTYTASLEYITQYIDAYEPNNGPLTATPLSDRLVYNGLIDTTADEDWFRFTVTNKKLVKLDLGNIPLNTVARVELIDADQNSIAIWKNVLGATSLEGQRILEKGTYYVVVTANRAFLQQTYDLEMRQETTSSSFTDLVGHWASADVETLYRAGWIKGYPDGRFLPNKTLSRGEGVTAMVRAIGLQASSTKLRFTDIPTKSWLYEYVTKADRAGWLAPYTSSQFLPNQAMTRGEAAQLIATAIQLNLPARPSQVFNDVSAKDPLAGVLEAMKQEGLISGYIDGTFKPSATITRAEWSKLLAKVYRR
ncbi:MAG: S8 family serine peptidase [Candidatus Cohnella colombiensis]|uniref:S8 family serine peptidase n=1 Tax=Candidatus Cohnella colombiensis TaxID=3121368 RepID=A0AA95EXX4_9BACL|nr:MAG: S8 family serine peptidase [Cohnella sp.]